MIEPLALFDGRRLIGHITTQKSGRSYAKAADGKFIGDFSTFAQAKVALLAHDKGNHEGGSRT